ncbi:MAG: GNAT family N-acetyltransferase [Eubacteriales bacterium]|nr:GNAT family N-acetyltransferase [Eubacteriales bacterium]
MKIRTAVPEDAERLVEIYAPYVENTAITFEYEVPTVENFRKRITDTLEQYPYLVAEEDGHILGYAYAGTFKGRPAYDWSVELSIYVEMGHHKSGVGKALYLELEKILQRMHVRNLYACIADPEVEDPHLNRNSEEFHAHMGYKKVGEFHRCGYKFETWYHMIWMEKILTETPVKPEPFLPFSKERNM